MFGLMLQKPGCLHSGLMDIYLRKIYHFISVRLWAFYLFVIEFKVSTLFRLFAAYISFLSTIFIFKRRII